MSAPEPKHDASSEEVKECRICSFMKGGDCRDAYVGWKQCLATNDEEDKVVAKCLELTLSLGRCMRDHSDYYDPDAVTEVLVKEMAEAVRNGLRELAALENTVKEDVLCAWHIHGECYQRSMCMHEEESYSLIKDDPYACVSRQPHLHSYRFQ